MKIELKGKLLKLKQEATRQSRKKNPEPMEIYPKDLLLLFNTLDELVIYLDFIVEMIAKLEGGRRL